MAKNLHKGDEAGRRSKIIKTSRNSDGASLPQLLARLDSDETAENKRHIYRALGNIGGAAAEEKLLQALARESGLALGDIVHSLGKLKCQRALPAISPLADHPAAWVRQNAKFALAQIRDES